MVLFWALALSACSPARPAADVVVVGAGAAGLAAATAARRAGAEVILLERDAVPGGASRYGGIFWAAGTRFQRSDGVEDAPQLALEEWAALTEGGDPTDPAVEAFVEGSGEVVEWLVDELGTPFVGVAGRPEEGSAPRNHTLGSGDEAAVYSLAEALDAEVRTGHEAVDLVWDGAAVAGVRCIADGEEVEVGAGSVVVATGGFARDLARVYADRDDLAGVPLGFDHAPGVDGGGHALLAGAGGTWHNPGALAVYVHAVGDWRPGHEGELVYAHGLAGTLIAGPDGARVGDESQVIGFGFADHLAAAGRLVAVYPLEHFEAGAFLVAEYNLGGWEEGLVSTEALVDAGVATVTDDREALAAALDLDPAGLAASIDAYEAGAAAGKDAEHGKSSEWLLPFRGRYAGVELRGGASKAFSGWRTDPEMRVLDSGDQPIPGLFAAGEAIGFLGTPAVGRGFPGSMTAVYWSGLRAGESAGAR